MGTKTRPGHYDCYAKARPDEPIFVLLARDPDAPAVVRFWATLRAQRDSGCPKVQEAEHCADAMEDYAATLNLRDDSQAGADAAADTERSGK